MNINKITLSFENDTEKVYREYYYRDSKKAFRFSFLLVTILYGAFGFLDAAIVPEYKSYFFFIRYAVVVPFLTLTLLLSFVPAFKSIWQMSLLMCYLVAGIGIQAMIIRVPENYTYYSGLMLIFSAGYFFIKLRFFYASIAGIILMILFNVLMNVYTSIEPRILFAYNFFYLSANLISMVGAYYLEYSYRRNFLLNRQLDESRADLEKTNRNLESEVFKRTEELYLAKEKAEESDRLKSAFLANVSHEIRTPMNGILGFADLLKEPGLTGEEHVKYLRIIETSGERMLSIIQDIMDISKIESGIMEVNLSKSNINDLIDFIYAFFSPEAKSKGLTLLTSPGLSDPYAYILTDRDKLSAILTNLIKNAIKFCQHGSVTFGYEYKDDSFLFFVKDTGPGIAVKDQATIFDRFMQVKSPGQQFSQGSGLGLSISKAFITMMGGQIWIESELGKGTDFYFTIPAGSTLDGHLIE